MAARRTIYLIILMATFMLYVFHTEYLSWMLFVVVVFVPIASCLMTLPFLSRYDISLRWSKQCIPETQMAFLAVYTGQAFPVSGMRITVKINNLYYGDEAIREIIMRPGQETIPAIYDAGKRCGVIRAEIERAKVQDFLGLFLLPVSCTEPVEILILPSEIPFVGGNLQIKALRQMEAQDLLETSLRGMGDREQRDVREYKEGDTLRDIHWKLTARQDTLVVREYEPDGNQVAVIHMKMSEDTEEFRVCVGRFFGLANFLQDEKQPYRLLFGDSLSKPSKSAEEQYGLLRELLSIPPNRQKPDPDSDPPEKSHRLLFAVSDEDVVLYVDGVQREVFR